MQITLSHQSITRKSLEFRVHALEADTLLGEVITKRAPKVRIPGSRPGKAPRAAVREGRRA